MTAKGKTPPPRLVTDSRRAVGDDGPDEPTQETTIDFDIGSLGEELLDVRAERSREASGRAVVSAEIVDDNSTGAATPPELAARRGRRNTLVSAIPSMLAKSMRPASVATPAARPAGQPPVGQLPPGRPVGQLPPGRPVGQLPPGRPVGQPPPGRPTGTPVAEHAGVSRRVDAAAAQAVPAALESQGYIIDVGPKPAHVHSAPTAEQAIVSLGAVGALVQKARFCLDAGDMAEAVLAASAALTANEQAPETNVGNLTDTAGGPLAPIFTAGPVSKVPVMNRSDAELDTIALDELHWALLRRMNGHLTLDEVFRATKIPAIDALKIAASLLRDGVIRVQDRTRA